MYGVEVDLRGRKFTIPPLTLAAYERVWPTISAMESSSPIDQVRAAREVIHAALLSNYPDLKASDLDDLLDVGNIWPTFRTVMARTSEGKPPGEGAGP